MELAYSAVGRLALVAVEAGRITSCVQLVP